MSVEENKALVRRLVEVWNNRNWDVLDELMAPDCVDHYFLPGETQKTGLKGYKDAQIKVTNAFPDIKYFIEDIVAEGDKVAVHLTFSGTHKSEFLGIKPTCKQITVPEISIWRIVSGKFVEEWGFGDRLGALQQLGVIPPIS